MCSEDFIQGTKKYLLIGMAAPWGASCLFVCETYFDTGVQKMTNIITKWLA